MGIPEGAGKEEARKAYRTLARKYHPDVNPSPEAHKEFIRIQRAYDAIINGKTRRTTGRSPRPTGHSYNPPKTTEDLRRQRAAKYQEMRRRKAREQEAEFLRKVENFRNSLYFYPALTAYLLLGIMVSVTIATFILIPVVLAFSLETFAIALGFLPLTAAGIYFAIHAKHVHQVVFRDIFFRQVANKKNA